MVKKILFVIFFALLLTLSCVKVYADVGGTYAYDAWDLANTTPPGPCTITVSPGPDSNNGIVDNHTHNAIITVHNNVYDFLANTDYYAIMEWPGSNKDNILDGEKDDYKAPYVRSNDNGDLPDVASIKIPNPGNLGLNNVDGTGLLNQTGTNGNVFLAGTYTILIFTMQGGTPSPVCKGTFSVYDTYDYGYEHCKITIEHERDAAYLQIGKEIYVQANIWAGKSPDDKVTIEARPPDGSEGVGKQNVSVRDLQAGHFDMGKFTVPGTYLFQINWGNGPGGIYGNTTQCRRGPVTIYAPVPTPTPGGTAPTPSCNGIIVGSGPCTTDPADSTHNCCEGAKCVGQPASDGTVTNGVCLIDTSSQYYSGFGNDLSGAHWPTPADVCPSNTCTTAIGNIDTSSSGFIESIMRFVLSIAGGIALLLIIISGYRLIVSQGNPEHIKNAKDQLTAAIIGLLFVIFSLVILQVIGLNILGLPGFAP